MSLTYSKCKYLHLIYLFETFQIYKSSECFLSLSKERFPLPPWLPSGSPGSDLTDLHASWSHTLPLPSSESRVRQSSLRVRNKPQRQMPPSRGRCYSDTSGWVLTHPIQKGAIGTEVTSYQETASTRSKVPVHIHSYSQVWATLHIYSHHLTCGLRERLACS